MFHSRRRSLVFSLLFLLTLINYVDRQLVPVAAKVTREWSPAGETGSMNAFWNAGAYAGPAVGSLLVTWILTFSDWRMPFHIMAFAGFAWLAIWWLFFRQPEQARWLGKEERQHILATRAAQEPGRSRGGYLGLLRSRTLWVLAFLQGAAAYTQYMILSWLPGYLHDARGMSVTSSGLVSAIPFFISAVFGIAIGLASDRLARRAATPAIVRRIFLTITLAVSAAILFMPIVPNDVTAVVVISVSLTFVASSIALNLSLANDLLADSKLSARVNSCVVLGGNLFGLVAPIVTGYSVQATGLFASAFIIAGALLAVAAVLALTATRSSISVKPKDADPRLPSPSQAG